MDPAINKRVQKGPQEEQKGDPRKETQKRWKKEDLPPVQGNIRIWRLGPLGPQETGVNRREISDSHRREGVA